MTTPDVLRAIFLVTAVAATWMVLISPIVRGAAW